ncbi:hypothetical protein PMAYCL1PPCAC_26503, partial [Pristionchus mayeri]
FFFKILLLLHMISHKYIDYSSYKHMLDIPAYTLVDEGSERLWEDLKQHVRDLGWTATDNTVLWATPQLESTKCVFARRDDDGSMLGSCLWSEHEGIAWVGFYITIPSIRGCGLGREIWARTMERMRKKQLVIGLRAAGSMREKYASSVTPFEVSRIRKHILSLEHMKEFCARFDTPSGCLRMYGELTEEQQRDLRRFDREVTGRDRFDWICKLIKSPESQVAVLINDSKVCAYAAVSTVGHAERNMFKLGPCYASSVSEFAVLTKRLLQWVEKYPTGARIVLGILSGSAGERELEDVLGHRTGDAEMVALFSEAIEARMNLGKCYVPNNAHCHYDA